MASISDIPPTLVDEEGPRLMRKQKVLIVDDEHLIRLSLRKAIANEGCNVFTAASGMEALILFAQQKPDVVILDIRLPDTNGLVLLKMIKKLRPATTVIMATACIDAVSVDLAAKTGADDYLEKPFSLERLKSLVRCGR